jgi:hypothetical protein
MKKGVEVRAKGRIIARIRHYNLLRVSCELYLSKLGLSQHKL